MALRRTITGWAKEGQPGTLLKRVDPTLERYDTITERWDVELKCQAGGRPKGRAVEMIGKPYQLQYQQTMPARDELWDPDAMDPDNEWPGPADTEIVCQRQADGAWSVWCVVHLDAEEPHEDDFTRGIRTASDFCNAFLRCGEMYGLSSDLEYVSENIAYFEREDPELAAQLRKHLHMDIEKNTESPE
ncbi:MAG: hypothetical protein AB7N29_14735 [Vicinamibacterales bacterium]